MKKICFLLIFIVSILFSLSVYAEEYCPENTSQTHHYDAFVNMNDEHPHAGYLDCNCGSRYTLDKIYKYDCQECREELCDKGYHYYLNELNYKNENGKVYLLGSCMCGDEICLDIYTDEVSEITPIDKLFYSNGEIITDEKYPHVVLVNNEVQVTSDIDCEVQCASCSYMSEYIEEIYWFSIWEYEYGDREYYEGYIEDCKDYDYYSEEEHYELQDWLDNIRKLFK